MEAKQFKEFEHLLDDVEELKRDVRFACFRHVRIVRNDDGLVEVNISEQSVEECKEHVQNYYREPEVINSRFHTPPYGIGSTLSLLFGGVGMFNNITSTVGILNGLPLPVSAAFFMCGALGLVMFFRQ